MATRVLSPAIVPSTLVPEGWGPTKLVPAVLSADIECGRFMYLDENGKVAIYPLLDTYFLDGDTITTKAGIAYITAEAWHAALRTAGSTPFQQRDLALIPMTTGVAVEMNLYYDGQAGPEETLVQADLGDTVVFHRVLVGTQFIWTADKNSATFGQGGNYVTGTIVRLMDEVGTVNGRVLVTIDGTWRYEPFGFNSYVFRPQN